MIDTFRAVYRLSPELGGYLMGSRELGDATTAPAIGNLPLTGYEVKADTKFGLKETWSSKTPEFGWIGFQAIGETYTLAIERSLPKWVSPADECRVLSAREAQEAVWAYDELIRDQANGCLRGVPCLISRLDVYYQHEVGDTRGVIDKLRCTMPEKYAKRTASYDTTLMMQGRQRTFRIYDKGEEGIAKHSTGAENYKGVLRLEEQVRMGGKVMPRLYEEGLKINVEACRELVNERVGQICGQMLQAMPVEDLMRTGSWRTLFLAAHPEQLGTYRKVASRQSYYQAKRQVQSVRRRLIGVDLAIPEDAWAG